jgi:uncharacterized protein YndB with AHSA1/START domain
MRIALFALTLATTAVAHAEVKEKSTSGLYLVYSQTLKAPPAKVYGALGTVGKWWSNDHTYSGSAANLTLRTEAGGCFCEAWSSGTVEHGRVVAALPQKLLRIEAALGPLQELAVSGALTFTLAAEGTGTKLTVTYRVNGSPATALDGIAGIVDQVIGEQVVRFGRFVDTGKADAAPVAAPAPAPAKK